MDLNRRNVSKCDRSSSTACCPFATDVLLSSESIDASHPTRRTAQADCAQLVRQQVPSSTVNQPLRREIYESEAEMAKRIFADEVGGYSSQKITRRIDADGLPTPSGKQPVW